jgi:nickel transport protein
MKTLSCFLLFLFGASPTLAHDLWIERTPEGLEVRYGHARSAHGGEALIPYEEGFVRRVDCVDEAGEPGASGWSGGIPARIPGGCACVFALTSTGFWSKTAEGTKNVSKKEARSPLKSWQSFESVKRIERWGEALARPFTRDLEITPLENPLLLEQGAKIHLLVTLEGRPVEGATVAYDGEPRGLTGKDGRANLKIRHGGFQMIQAGLTVPLGSEDADEIIHATNLNFEIGGKE